MKQDIIDKIFQSGQLKSIIRNISKNSEDEDFKDLEQDIYMELLEKPENVIESIYLRGQINYYLTRIVTNNIKSKTSRFYYKYKKNKKIETNMDDTKPTEQAEVPDYY